MTKLLVVLGSLVAVAIIIFVGISGMYKNGVSQEVALTAQFSSEQAWLASFTNGFYEKYSLVGEESDVVNEILSNAVSGRYGEDGFSADGAMFSAVTENYPEASLAKLLDNWENVSIYVSGGRTEFARLQSKRLDMVRAYNLWLNGGLIKSVAIRALGFPTKNLKATVGEMTLTGDNALELISNVVTNEETTEAYMTGNHESMLGEKDE